MLLCAVVVRLHCGNTYLNVPQFIDSLTLDQHFGSFHFKAVINNDSVFLFVSLGTPKHTFPLALYLKVK